MKSSATLQHLKAGIASISAIALLLTVAIPHHHGKSSVSHPESTCRACRIQEGFAATPSAPALVEAQPVLVAVCALRPSAAPRISFTLRLSSPRAPPIFS